MQIEWLLRDEQLSTYFTRRTLDKDLIENVIEHVQSSVNIHKSNCLCRSIDLMFVLGINKSLQPFLQVISHLIKYIFTFSFSHQGMAKYSYSRQISSNEMW